jgi:integrase
MFEIARDEWGLPIRQNPVGKLKLKGTDKRRERRLRDGELDKLLHAAWRCRSPLIACIIRVAVETCLRRGEILSIVKQHIDPGRQSLLVPDTKNGDPRIIPLSADALAILQTCWGERADHKLFPMTANAFRLAWERVKRRAGISDLRFHDLRHEAISRLFEKGLTVPEVAMISGHRDMSEFDRAEADVDEARKTEPMFSYSERKTGQPDKVLSSFTPPLKATTRYGV